MGIPISNPVVHAEPVQTKYRADSCGSWTLEIVALLTVWIIPLIIGFSMGQFWITNNDFIEMPTMNYTGRVMLRAATSDGDEYLWASSSALQEALVGDARATHPLLSSQADDVDRDGKTDIFRFTIRIPLRDPTHNVVSVQFLPIFKYNLTNDLVSIAMETAPFVAFDGVNPTRARRLVLDGTVPFRQVDPVYSSNFYHYDVVYWKSYLDDALDVADLRDIGGFARKYAARNESTPFELRTAYFTDGTTRAAALEDPMDSDGIFTVSATLRVPVSTVTYVPSFSETIKFAWVQYFTIAYVIQWIFSGIRKVFVKNAFVDTVAEFKAPRRLLR